MKGIILAGGIGSRLYPLTKVTNKHLRPVYNKPMIYYPLHTLIDAGLDEILIVSGRGHAGHFLELLGSGSEWGIRLTNEIQDEAGGIAQALGLAEGFADEEEVVVILGDDIFQDSISEDDPRESPVEVFVEELRKKGARVCIVDLYIEDGYLERYGEVETDVYKALEGADAMVLMTAHKEFR